MRQDSFIGYLLWYIKNHQIWSCIVTVIAIVVGVCQFIKQLKWKEMKKGSGYPQFSEFIERQINKSAHINHDNKKNNITAIIIILLLCMYSSFCIAQEAIDLGLSVKWASCNLGATSPEEYGDYFAWGETSTKNEYSWNTYVYCKGTSTSMTKYCTNSSYGRRDNKSTLDLSDDVAHIMMGGNWRIPTLLEQKELLESCTWIWTVINGVSGFRVYSTKEGYTEQSIFLPASGYCYNSNTNGTNSNGSYWSSTLGGNSSNVAWKLNFNTSSQCNLHNVTDLRMYGFSVRPVCIAPTNIEELKNSSFKFQNSKFLKEGQLVILHEGKNYNAQGFEVK